VNRKIRNILASASAAALIGGGGIALAASASAAPTHPAFAPVQLDHHLSLVFGGTTYKYKVNLFVDPFDGSVTGSLYDQYLPGWLQVHGVDEHNVVVLQVSYPNGDPQGSRVFDLVKGGGPFPFSIKYTGVWTETGTEMGSGTAVLSH
jgi:hypothetical protein